MRARIVEASARWHAVPLARPYAIAYKQVDAIELGVVALTDEAGRVGLGTATPAPYVTGETVAACRAALSDDGVGWLRGADVRTLPALARRVRDTLPATPAARAAVDMALHDLLAQALGLPLVDLLGRAHDALPTSITIGIKPAAEALREADEYIARGFRILKVKLGRDVDEDVDRVRQLRAHVGRDVLIRVDPNQGYDVAATRRFFDATETLDLELVEQPVPVASTDELGALPESHRARIALDEAIIAPVDALRFSRPRLVGMFNVKLMKCGGVTPALDIARIADLASVSLMWGCMDESCVGIAAALHAALACPATRVLDLDGSFDLSRDVAAGGFVIESGGVLRPTGGAGLDAKLVT